MSKKAPKKISKIKKTEKGYIQVNKELQAAIDLFPKIVKRNEKAAREKLRIKKNFLSVKDKIYSEKSKADK